MAPTQTHLICCLEGVVFSKPTIVSFVWFHVFMVEGRFVSFFFVVVRFGFFIYIYI